MILGLFIGFVCILIDIFSVYLLLHTGRATNFILFHLLSSLILSVCLSILLRKRVKSLKENLLTFTAISLLIPVGGAVLTTTAFYFLYRTKKTEEKLTSKALDVEEVLNEFVVVKPRKFGEGALRIIAQFEGKEKLLLFLKDLLNPFSVEAAKKFLKERNDEVRLGAFSILVKLEKEINNRISRLKEMYEAEEDKVKRAKIAKEIASYYWELLYFNLVDPELEDFIVKEALKYAEESLEVLKDSNTAFIAGRIFLKQKKIEKARKSLLFAYKTGNRIEKNRVIPYLAEAEYYMGNLKNVRKLFGELPYSIYPNVQFAKVFWSGSEKRP